MTTPIRRDRRGRPGGAEAAGVLILADGYPQKTTAIEPAVIAQAAKKKLRLYVEYPAGLPDMRVAARGDDVGAGRRGFRRLRPVARGCRTTWQFTNCRFVEVQAAKPYLVVRGQVADFDRAVYGLDDVKAYPISSTIPAATCWSGPPSSASLCTARYATKDALRAVWKMISGRLQPGREVPAWTGRPPYGPPIRARPNCRPMP